jgi:outer membrane protein assembly factor BamB
VLCLDTDGNGDGTTTQYWRYTMPYQTMASATIDDGLVYIGDGAYTVTRPSYNVYAIDLDSNGELAPLSEEWHYTGSEVFISSAIPYNDKIFIGDLGGTVHCITPPAGFGKAATADWTYDTGNEIWGSTTIANDRLLIGNFDGDLYCIDTDSGDLVWTIDLSDSEIYTTATIVDDKIYISSNDGKLFCLGEKGLKPENTPAFLTDGKVEPESGDEDDIFTFSVLYTDLDDDPPEFVYVYIDGEINEMYRVSTGSWIEYDYDYTNGERYIYETELYVDSYIYYFETYDGVSYVTTNTLSLKVEKSDNNDNVNNNGDDTEPQDSNNDDGSSDSTPAFELILIIMSIVVCIFNFKKSNMSN